MQFTLLSCLSSSLLLTGPSSIRSAKPLCHLSSLRLFSSITNQNSWTSHPVDSSHHLSGQLNHHYCSCHCGDLATDHHPSSWRSIWPFHFYSFSSTFSHLDFLLRDPLYSVKLPLCIICMASHMSVLLPALPDMPLIVPSKEEDGSWKEERAVFSLPRIPIFSCKVQFPEVLILKGWIR